MCIYTVWTYFFSESWLLSIYHHNLSPTFLLPQPISLALAFVAVAFCPPLPFNFQICRGPDMWLEAPLPPPFVLLKLPFLSLFTSQLSGLTFQFLDSSTKTLIMVPQKFHSWLWHWTRALPACSCPGTLAARSQLWYDYWHTWPSGLSGGPFQPHQR